MFSSFSYGMLDFWREEKQVCLLKTGFHLRCMHAKLLAKNHRAKFLAGVNWHSSKSAVLTYTRWGSGTVCGLWMLLNTYIYTHTSYDLQNYASNSMVESIDLLVAEALFTVWWKLYVFQLSALSSQKYPQPAKLSYPQKEQTLTKKCANLSRGKVRALHRAKKRWGGGIFTAENWRAELMKTSFQLPMLCNATNHNMQYSCGEMHRSWI